MGLDIFPALSVFTNFNAIFFRWISSARVSKYSKFIFFPPRGNTRFENKFRENCARTLVVNRFIKLCHAFLYSAIPARYL